MQNHDDLRAHAIVHVRDGAADVQEGLDARAPDLFAQGSYCSGAISHAVRFMLEHRQPGTPIAGVIGQLHKLVDIAALPDDTVKRQ